MGYWQLEKTQMQQTIIALGEEVEYLSVRNQGLIEDMKRKDPFYETYVKTTDELTKLRQAHAILISMIKGQQLNIADHEKIKGVDKFELQVPVNNNKYRGGNPISYQQKLDKNGLPIPSGEFVQTPIFCGFGSNAKRPRTVQSNM